MVILTELRPKRLGKFAYMRRVLTIREFLSRFSFGRDLALARFQTWIAFVDHVDPPAPSDDTA